MTAAVCLQCGEIKLGAWTACRNCGHTPASDEEKARQLLASDHVLSEDALNDLAKDIGSGKPPPFDAEQVAQMQEAMKTASAQTQPQVDIRKVKIGCFVVLAVIVGVVVWLVLR